MTTPTPADAEKRIALGQEIYETRIRHLVEPHEHGKLLALDITTGDYVIARRLGQATDELLQRRPDAIIHSVRIGHPTVYRFLTPGNPRNKAAPTGHGSTPTSSGKLPDKGGFDMTTPTTDDADVEKRMALGQEIYETRIRHLVEPGGQGKYVVLDIATGDYAIGTDVGYTTQELRTRRPDAILYTVRIGYPSVYHLRGPKIWWSQR